MRSARLASPAAIPAFGALLCAGAFILSVLAPLATYTCTLAFFGLPHVLAELRYVGRRFAGRWPWALVGAVGALLACVVALRIGGLLGAVPTGTGRVAELALVLTMSALALPILWRRGPSRALIGGALIAAVAVGVAVDPLITAVILAGLHNLTPVGFIAEGAAPDRRRRLLGLALIAFVALPLLIASGGAYQGLTAALPPALEWSPLAGGHLADHLSVYVPSPWVQSPWALHVFSAFVFTQCMHYAVVIHGLPRLTEDAGPRWPVAVALIIAGAVAGWMFLGDFGGGRRIYGVIAAVHAWVELPILLALAAGSADEGTSSLTAK